ncbi:MAG: hypothetical protein MMC23_007334 [Stictis urceolatum]|nr:hypothetical protein [Stictis urceolata]
MVCAKCQKAQSQTQLATPGVKRKNELYYGSPSAGATSAKGKPSATLGQTGIGKSKLLSKAAKNPYAAFASNCKTCKAKVEQGRTYCQKCAYKTNACAMCGKSQSRAAKGQPVVEGQKFSAK